MDSSAIVIQGTPAGVSQVAIFQSGNPTRRMVANLNTKNPQGYSDVIFVGRLNLQNGAPLAMSVIRNGLDNVVFLKLPGPWRYNSAGNVQIVRLEEVTTGAYVLTLLTEACNSVVCSNNAAVIASFSFINLDQNSNRGVLYTTNKIPVFRSTIANANQIGNLKLVEAKANVLAGRASSFQPLLLYAGSPYVAGLVLTGTAFSTTLRLQTLQAPSLKA